LLLLGEPLSLMFAWVGLHCMIVFGSSQSTIPRRTCRPCSSTGHVASSPYRKKRKGYDLGLGRRLWRPSWCPVDTCARRGLRKRRGCAQGSALAVPRALPWRREGAETLFSSW
jgi:hypothetical protein